MSSVTINQLGNGNCDRTLVDSPLQWILGSLLGFSDLDVKVNVLIMAISSPSFFFQVWQDMMDMQKTIEERNKTIDEQERKLREASLKQGKSEELNQTVTGQLKTEQEQSKEEIRTLTEQLKSVREEKSSLEERFRIVTSGS